jgi:hypothetical protein
MGEIEIWPLHSAQAEQIIIKYMEICENLQIKCDYCLKSKKTAKKEMT